MLMASNKRTGITLEQTGTNSFRIRIPVTCSSKAVELVLGSFGEIGAEKIYESLCRQVYFVSITDG